MYSESLGSSSQIWKVGRACWWAGLPPGRGWGRRSCVFLDFLAQRTPWIDIRWDHNHEYVPQPNYLIALWHLYLFLCFQNTITLCQNLTFTPTFWCNIYSHHNDDKHHQASNTVHKWPPRILSYCAPCKIKYYISHSIKEALMCIHLIRCKKIHMTPFV